MPSKLFTNMLKDAEAAGVKAKATGSNNWFRNKAKEVRKADVQRILADSQDRYRQAITPGTMFMFYYDPKLKDKLPYYDTFPLIFPLAIEKDSILGINMHYLPPALRAKLMDALYENVTNDKMNDTTRMRISYSILTSAAKYSLFKPCIKRYLKAHVRSRFVKVYPNEWDYTLFLPIEQFQKARKEKVWADSRRIAGYK
jgi:hypothetical protein